MASGRGYTKFNIRRKTYPPLRYIIGYENSDEGIYRVRIKASTTRKNSLKVQSGNNKVIVPFHFHLDTIFRREHPS